MKQTITTLFVFAALTLACQAATAEQLPAECPKRPVDEDSARALAGTWFKKGAEAAEAGRYEEALQYFNCSLQMVEHPDTMFNAAQSARLAENRNEALRHARRYLVLDPEGKMAAEAAALVQAIEDEIEEEHQEKERKLREEEQRKAALEEEERAKRLSEESTDEDTEPSDEPRTSPLKTTGWIAVGVGGASLVAGGVLQGLAGKAASDGEKDGISYDKRQDFENDMKSYQTGALVGFIVGGVALGAGIVLLVLSDDEDTGAEISLAPSFRGFTLSGKF